MHRDDSPLRPASSDAREWINDALAQKRLAEESAQSAADADDRIAGAFYDAYRGVQTGLMGLLKDVSQDLHYTTDLNALMRELEPKLAQRTLTLPREVAKSVGGLAPYHAAHAWPTGEASRRAVELEEAVGNASRAIGWIEQTHSVLSPDDER